MARKLPEPAVAALCPCIEPDILFVILLTSAQLLYQVTLKLVPSPESPEGAALRDPFLLTMVML